MRHLIEWNPLTYSVGRCVQDTLINVPCDMKNINTISKTKCKQSRLCCWIDTLKLCISNTHCRYDTSIWIHQNSILIFQIIYPTAMIGNDLSTTWTRTSPVAWERLSRRCCISVMNWYVRLDLNEPARIMIDDLDPGPIPTYSIAVRLVFDKHDGFWGSTLGSSIVNNEPPIFGKSDKPYIRQWYL